MSTGIPRKAINRLVAELADQVVPKPAQIAKLDGAAWESEASVELDGTYTFDEHGELSIMGRVTVSPEGLPVEAPEISGGFSDQQSAQGAGKIRLKFRAKLEIKPAS